MARSARKSLTSTASAVARKALGRRSASGAEKTAAEPATKSAPTSSSTTKKASTKTPAKKAASKTTASKATAKTTAAKKTAAKTTAAKKTATKAPVKKAASKTTAKKTATTKTPAAPAPAKKAAQKTPATQAAQKTPATKTTKKATVKKASAPVRRATDARAKALPTLDNESPWTKADLAEVLDDLHSHRDRIQEMLSAHESELAGLMRDAGDGAGHDAADVGTSSFERDQEMTVVNNERDMLVQIDAALKRIGDGTYGVCESCGNPIGKGRLMAFPRASLCLTCKQRQERR